MNGQYDSGSRNAPGAAPVEYCMSCGKEMIGGGSFCMSCGARQNVVDARPGPPPAPTIPATPETAVPVYAPPPLAPVAPPAPTIPPATIPPVRPPVAYTQPPPEPPPYWAAQTPGAPQPQPQPPAKKKIPLAAVLIPVIAVVVVAALVFGYIYLFSGNRDNKPSGYASESRDSERESRDDDRGGRDDGRDDGAPRGNADAPAAANDIDNDGDAESGQQGSESGGEADSPGDSQSSEPGAEAGKPTPGTSAGNPTDERPDVPPAPPSMTGDEARRIVVDWLAGHQFPVKMYIDPWVGEETIYGDEYFTVYMYTDYTTHKILVRKDTGELSVFQLGEADYYVIALDHWYYSLLAPKSLEAIIFDTIQWVRIYARWSATSATVFERDRDSLVWTMQSRDGSYRIVDAWFDVENGAITIGFPTTSTKYNLYPDGTGNFGSETLTWEAETNPFYTNWSINAAYQTYDLREALNYYSLIAIHVRWPNGDTAIFYRQSSGAWMMKQRGGGFSSIDLSFGGSSNQITISSSSIPGVFTLNDGGAGTFGSDSITWDYSFMED